MTPNQPTINKFKQDLAVIDEALSNFLRSQWKSIQSILDYKEEKLSVTTWWQWLYLPIQIRIQKETTTIVNDMVKKISDTIEISDKIKLQLETLLYNRLILEEISWVTDVKTDDFIK